MPDQILSGNDLLYDPNKMSWGHKFYDLPFIWKDLLTKGKQATVAVVDTGIDSHHPDLAPNINPSSINFINNSSNIEDTDGHGTRMAGIIAGAGTQQVFGVAPESKIVVVKATNTQFGAEPKNFAKALNHVSTIKEVDIISISYTFTVNDEDLKQAVKACLDQGKIIVAAIGNMRNDEVAEDDDTYPSAYSAGFAESNAKKVLAVGAFNSQGKLSSFSNWNRHINLIAPGANLLTANIGNAVIKESGTSIATAFTAGCLALMVSWAKINRKTGIDYPGLLKNTCDDYGPQIGFDIMSGLGLMNLRNALSKLKQQ